MKSKLINSIEYIMDFGLSAGLKILVLKFQERLHVKKQKLVALKIKNVDKPIYLRKGTLDARLFANLYRSNGEYDFCFTEKYKAYFNEGVIVDAGANIGLFSKLVLENTTCNQIIAIEPESRNYNVLKKNLDSYKNVNCMKNGLWNKKTELVVKDIGKGEWGFIVEEVKEGKVNESVSAIDIPYLMNLYKLDHIDVLKIDIEGSEYEVFDESCEKWIDKVSLLIIETHDFIKEGCNERVEDVILKHGFKNEKVGENQIYIKSNNRTSSIYNRIES